MEPRWTLDELVAQVAAALADGYAGPADRRARQIPDRRAIRWYTTIGVLDRPQVRGRTGWYGERHLLQLVAVKRMQAAGRSLSEIQNQLAGADDSTLRQIADLPEQSAVGPASPAEPNRPVRPASATAAKFWTRPAGTEPDHDLCAAGLRLAVELADGVTLLIRPPRDAVMPDRGSVAAIRAGARQLLDVLARLGLASHQQDPHYGEGESP